MMNSEYLLVDLRAGRVIAGFVTPITGEPARAALNHFADRITTSRQVFVRVGGQPPIDLSKIEIVHG